MKETKLDLGLKGYNQLFSSDGKQGKPLNIVEIPLSEIDDAPNHPFKVAIDEDMYKLVDSIRDNGILVPAIVRKKIDGRYELVAGHRRKKACEIAGLETLKSEIRDLSYDQAVVVMVDSNFQRSKLLPSELAFSYKMRMDALKRQGKRTDVTSTPVVAKLRTGEELGKVHNDSREQVRRYIRLTKLIKELLDMVDEEKIAFRPAVELSYLTKEEQQMLLETIKSEEATPSLSQALKLKQLSKDGELDEDRILDIMCERKPNQVEKLMFKADILRPYIPRTIITPKETEAYIIKALEYYREHRKGAEDK